MNMSTPKIPRCIIPLCLIYFSFFGPRAIGQSTTQLSNEVFRINFVELDKNGGQINVLMTANDEEGNPLFEVSKEDPQRISLVGLSIYEQIGQRPFLEVTIEDGLIRGNTQQYESTDSIAADDDLNVLFLLDRSGSMLSGDKFELAKRAIQEMIIGDYIPTSSISIATFDDEISENKNISRFNYTNVLRELGEPNWKLDTDLYRAIQLKINELKGYPGRKVLIVLTDGKNDASPRKIPYYRISGEKPMERRELLDEVMQLDTSFQIFPIGVGTDPDESFLDSLGIATINPNDGYQSHVEPVKIQKTFKKILNQLTDNAVFRIISNDNNFGPAESRTYKVVYKKEKEYQAEKTATFKGFTDSTQIKKEESFFYNLPVFPLVLGLSIVTGLLFLFMGVIPWYYDWQFFWKYVFRYKKVKRTGVNILDPHSGQPLRNNALVVTGIPTCRYPHELTPLSLWRAKGDRCTACKDDCDYRLGTKNGVNALDQKDVNTRLKWVWFGVLGGFLAWVFNAFLFALDWTAYENLLRSLLDDREATLQVSELVANQTISGVAIGLGLSVALSYLEEVAQSRAFSIGRIIIRLFAAVVFSYIIHFGAALGIGYLSLPSFLEGLMGWTVFGTALGGILTIQSSIPTLNGIKGGLVAGIVAYFIYYLMLSDSVSDLLGQQIGQMMAFLCYGGILGGLMIFVIDKLEDYYFRVIAPSESESRRIPISKWLKTANSEGVLIGTDRKKCSVWIKWRDDVAQPIHAALFYYNNAVFIEAYQRTGTVLVQNREIRRRTRLKHGDVVQLGHQSRTKLKFISQARESEVDNHDPFPSNFDNESYQPQEDNREQQTGAIDNGPKIIIRK